MKVSWLLGLLAITLMMVSAEEKVPDGFQQWTGASLKELEQALKTEAGASAPHIAVRRLGDFAQDTFMLSRREADGVVDGTKIRPMYSLCNPARRHSWWAARW